MLYIKNKVEPIDETRVTLDQYLTWIEQIYMAEGTPINNNGEAKVYVIRLFGNRANLDGDERIRQIE
jgi:hypothetical protein